MGGPDAFHPDLSGSEPVRNRVRHVKASDPHLVCTAVSDGNTACETPGNAQLTSSPPDVPYPSLYPFLLGGGLIFHDGGGHGMR